MIDDMGIFRTDVRVENPVRPGVLRVIHSAMVDTVCFGNIYVQDTSAPEILVFAEPGDMTLLGARGLEGLNLRVDVTAKRLVSAGPVPAAAAA